MPLTAAEKQKRYRERHKKIPKNMKKQKENERSVIIKQKKMLVT